MYRDMSRLYIAQPIAKTSVVWCLATRCQLYFTDHVGDMTFASSALTYGYEFFSPRTEEQHRNKHGLRIDRLQPSRRKNGRPKLFHLKYCCFGLTTSRCVMAQKSAVSISNQSSSGALWHNTPTSNTLTWYSEIAQFECVYRITSQHSISAVLNLGFTDTQGA